MKLKNKTLKLSIVLLVVLLLFTNLFATTTITSPRKMSLRQQAMGGVGVSCANDLYMTYQNPALLRSTNTRYGESKTGKKAGGLFTPNFLHIQPQLIGITAEQMIGILSEQGKYLTEEILFKGVPEDADIVAKVLGAAENLDRQPVGFKFQESPLDFGFVARKLPISFHLASGFDFSLTFINSFIPSLNYDLGGDAGILFGIAPYSFDVKEDWMKVDLGANLKTAMLMRSKATLPVIEAAGFVDSIGGVRGDNLMSWLFQNSDLGFVFAGDLGANVTFDTFLGGMLRGLSGGVVVRDIGAFIAPEGLQKGIKDGLATSLAVDKNELEEINFKETSLRPTLNIGAAYTLPILKKIITTDAFLANPIVAIDLQDIFAEKKSFGTMLHMGASIDLINFYLLGLNLSFGFNGPFVNPTIGTELRLLHAIRLGYAYVNEPISRYINAGSKPKHIVHLGVVF